VVFGRDMTARSFYYHFSEIPKILLAWRGLHLILAHPPVMTGALY
jgi:hypothetical protein